MRWQQGRRSKNAENRQRIGDIDEALSVASQIGDIMRCNTFDAQSL